MADPTIIDVYVPPDSAVVLDVTQDNPAPPPFQYRVEVIHQPRIEILPPEPDAP